MTYQPHAGHRHYYTLTTQQQRDSLGPPLDSEPPPILNHADYLADMLAAGYSLDDSEDAYLACLLL